MKNKLIIEKEFLHPQEDNLETLLNKTVFLQKQLQVNNYLNPKFYVDSFNYQEELRKSYIPEQGKNSEEVLASLTEMFEGSIRPQSPYALFNMVPSPLLDTVAATTMTQLYNSNSLMDAFGGKTILFEQRIARAIGRLVGWEESHGISCNGGKLTLLYAIKSAISKISPESRREGVPKDLVILTNEGAHYCVEHVCSLLGLGANQCIRVRTKEDWRMDVNDLKQVIQEQLAKDKRIAAIVCCGGTTINFACDDTNEVYQCVEQVFKETEQTYFPYFHLDSVIGWLWFNFIGLSEREWEQRVENPEIRFKIKRVIEKMEGVSRFDSFGVDMHKNGLCPYSTSMFVSKTDECFNYLNEGTYTYSENDYEFGNFRAYRYTIENSRPATGIAAAWVAMNRLGRNGFQEYLVRLHTLSLLFEKELKNLNGISVINSTSLGWEIVFTISFHNILTEFPHYNANEIAKAFIQYCWSENHKGREIPLISIVPEFKVTPDDTDKIAFLLYPMSLFSEEKSGEIIKKLATCINEFESKVILRKIPIKDCVLEKPIR
ncbi:MULTISPECIES: pyridoxal phosphate-dependent decarboxylase family protein [Bacillus cereus group]|uniref:pyridoxal phosphate-dependent decarboxylase family protein n=1 Tax=Bacillus cereus group TaxID=86661 RepID=UPI000BF9CED8|nr:MULTISPECIES: pyridoxal-dependent decarboxylase [Bacillus cereus group]PEW07877.1 glutamate decarboxylase [Bacillus cereus]PFE93884.1 glutamate decarboxylase [Bacillus thuringiensis]PGW73989.1 glutamate decarboxylase [Bacillus thuringiensis]